MDRVKDSIKDNGQCGCNDTPLKDYIEYLEGLKQQLQTPEIIKMLSTKGVRQDVIERWIKTTESEILSVKESRSIKGNYAICLLGDML